MAQGMLRRHRNAKIDTSAMKQPVRLAWIPNGPLTCTPRSRFAQGILASCGRRIVSTERLADAPCCKNDPHGFRFWYLPTAVGVRDFRGCLGFPALARV
jgi:hypothetical protein